MLAPLLVLFVGLIVLPMIFVASIGRGGPILWVGAIVLVGWLVETVMERARSGPRRPQRPRRPRDARHRCLGCGHELIPVQQRCPECDHPRDAVVPVPEGSLRTRGWGPSERTAAGIHDVHR